MTARACVAGGRAVALGQAKSGDGEPESGAHPQQPPRFFLLSERVICSNCRSFSRSLSYLLCESNAAHSSSLAPEQIVWKTKTIFLGEEFDESSLSTQGIASLRSAPLSPEELLL